MKQVCRLNEWAFPIAGPQLKLPLYLVGVGNLANQDHVVRPSGYPNYQVIYCTKGAGLLCMGGVERPVTERQALILYPDVPHEYYAVQEPWETHWLTFDGDSVGVLMQTLGFRQSGVYYLKDSFAIDDLWNQTLHRAKSSAIKAEFHCSALVYQFLMELMESVSEEPALPNDRRLSQFYTVLSYIDAHFGSDIGLQELAERIDVSQQYLCRLFRKYLKIRPFEYITRRRVQQAKNLLVQTACSESEIAAACGFNSISYFCAVFKRYEKITPAAFRSLYAHAE
jgi:AraC-like DNA-binding protein